MDMVKAALHQLIELHRLTGSFKVSDERGLVNEVTPPQSEETAEESVRRGESGHVHVSTPGLLKDPPEQAERVQASTEMILRNGVTQRTEGKDLPH